MQRECAAARQGVGVQDVSTLGKIDIQGPDTLEFLNRIYTNALDTLAVGSCRYSVMCKPDGMFFDDGVVVRCIRAHARSHLSADRGIPVRRAEALDLCHDVVQLEDSAPTPETPAG